MQKRSLLLILALTAALPSHAATLTSGTWYHVVTDDSMAATAGSDGGALFSNPGAVPWTFSLLSAGTLEFFDAQISGDKSVRLLPYHRLYQSREDPTTPSSAPPTAMKFQSHPPMR